MAVMHVCTCLVFSIYGPGCITNRHQLDVPVTRLQRPGPIKEGSPLASALASALACFLASALPKTTKKRSLSKEDVAAQGTCNGCHEWVANWDMLSVCTYHGVGIEA